MEPPGELWNFIVEEHDPMLPPSGHALTNLTHDFAYLDHEQCHETYRDVSFTDYMGKILRPFAPQDRIRHPFGLWMSPDDLPSSPIGDSSKKQLKTLRFSTYLMRKQHPSHPQGLLACVCR